MLINSQSPTVQTTPSKCLPPTDAKTRVSQFMRQLQDDITQKLEQVDGTGKFKEDHWQRAEGGGGRSRIMTEGSIFEKAGVGFSEVSGDELPPSILAQRPEAAGHNFYVRFGGLVVVPI